MRALTLTLIQTELTWEDSAANLAMFTRHIEALREPTDLIVLPEMFTTGFSMNAQRLAEPMEGPAVTWLRRTATAAEADIVGSVIIAENGRFYNRLLWAKPDGRLLTYDKKHLFRFAGEEKVYTAGNRLVTVEVAGWQVRPFICYDLRFPTWLRNVGNRYDLALFVANWPQRRSHHWRLLLRARAIENQAWVVGLNRVGVDGNGFDYSGDSAVIDPLGRTRFQRSGTAVVHTLTLDGDAVAKARQAFPAWMDMDADLIDLPQ